MPWQVACELIAASRKLASQGFTADEAWRRLGELLSVLPLIVPSPHALDLARTLHIGQQWSFWDATLVAACVSAGINRHYSEDVPGAAAPAGLEITNPFV